MLFMSYTRMLCMTLKNIELHANFEFYLGVNMLSLLQLNVPILSCQKQILYCFRLGKVLTFDIDIVDIKNDIVLGILL